MLTPQKSPQLLKNYHPVIKRGLVETPPYLPVIFPLQFHNSFIYGGFPTLPEGYTILAPLLRPKKHAQGAKAQQLPHDLFDGTAGRPSLFSNDAPVSAVHEELEEAKKRGTPCGMRARLGAAGGDLSWNVLEL
jgi:hypothetical protein